MRRVERESHAQFLARMGHELRTPLTSLLGFTALLQRETQGVLQADQKTKLDHVRAAGEHLLFLINAMLGLSCLDADAVVLDLRPVPLDEVVEQALPMVQLLAARHRVRFACPASLAAIVLADHTRLRQVLINLLTNAIKYNGPGGEVRLEAQGDSSGTTLTVCDDGCGMSVEQIEHLFEPFNRLGKEHSGIDGTGIGLALSKALVERMGGRISVLSWPNRGSRFGLWLPRAGADANGAAYDQCTSVTSKYPAP